MPNHTFELEEFKIVKNKCFAFEISEKLQRWLAGPTVFLICIIIIIFQIRCRGDKFVMGANCILLLFFLNIVFEAVKF